MSESVILENKTIVVTSKKLKIKNSTFLIESIDGVSIGSIGFGDQLKFAYQASSITVLFLMIGIFTTGNLHNALFLLSAFAFLCSIICAIVMSVKPQPILKISIGGREVRIWSSYNRKMLEEAKDAIEKACFDDATKQALRDAPAVTPHEGEGSYKHQGEHQAPHEAPHEAPHKSAAPLLKEGSQGDYVLAAQLKLSFLHYTGPNEAVLLLDGKFGPATNFAVREFQRENGLSQDGIIGPHTGQRLDNSYARNVERHGYRVPGTRESGTPDTGPEHGPRHTPRHGARA